MIHSLSPTSPHQAATLKPKNPGRILVPLAHVKRWLLFHSLSLDERKARLRKHIEKEGGKEGDPSPPPPDTGDGDRTSPPSFPPSPKKKQQQKRITKAQTALVQAHIHRRPQHLALILSLPPSLRQEWRNLSLSGGEGREEWKEKHVLVMEFCMEVGLTPKQLYAAVRRMAMKAKEGGKDGGVEEEGKRREVKTKAGKKKLVK